MKMSKKIVATVLTGTALVIGSVLYINNTTNASMSPEKELIKQNSINSHITAHKEYAQTEKKDVYDKLYKTWENATEKIISKYDKDFDKKDWELIADPDIDIRFKNMLSSQEASAYSKASIQAKEAYEMGDFLDCVLLHKDKNKAKIVWEKHDGKIHVAHLEKKGNDWVIVLEENIE
ncbi:hypothetical protein GC102_23295 [Paenibacillus sp. LMG 31460]|uniref:Uncharacterized protein n=1 Tax=Paenibacillus germinis TaxID=2654979 RepID=A0ABX1Z9Y7_9BACL|nr:hypothetical protein [Paenibacillus germinis]NOU88655.1 hypothetical protein [Paenibacillus germinis]